MTIISRLGLLNQQMAGLASSLAGKTGTFQVFILIFCHPLLLCLSTLIFCSTGFGEKAWTGATWAGKPFWTNHRRLCLQRSLYTSCLQTCPRGENTFNIIKVILMKTTTTLTSGAESRPQHCPHLTSGRGPTSPTGGDCSYSGQCWSRSA